MGTKEKIVLKAIELYNTHGFSNITSRDIARALKISHGNLDYHYNNKEALLDAIYSKMKDEVSSYFAEVDRSNSPFSQFNTLLIKLDQFQFKYRFFNLDVLEISRKYPRLKEKIEATIQIRKEQMAHFFSLFHDHNYITKEPITGFYERLQHKIRIIITFWVSQTEILEHYSLSQEISLSLTIWDLILPHMTKKGKEEYNKLEFPGHTTI